MLRITTRFYLPTLLTLLLFPLSAQAALPAITCHCFTDRAYDAEHPTAADPYFLATTQNTFLALVFNVEKRSIVMSKQKGIDADDLWVAHWIASRSGVPADSLLQNRQTKGSWKDAVPSRGISAKTVGTRFFRELNAGATAARLAQEVVDGLLTSHRLIADTELAAMRKEWATNQEVILAAVIAGKTRQPARQIWLDVKKGGKSWGGLLQAAHLDAAALPDEISAQLNPRSR